MLSCGIVGLPNAGKSTLFNALLSRQIANVAPYPFCTIEPNIGVVEVPDKRLSVLAKIVDTDKIIPAVVKFVDIAGLVAGAHKGEGLGNQFLAHIRECDAIIHVVRDFKDGNVTREQPLNPKSDLETIITELCLADLQTLEKQDADNSVIIKVKEQLEKGNEVRKINLTDKEWDVIKPLFLLTAKPAIVVLNVDEKDLGKAKETEEMIPICAKIEMELAQLEPAERKEYLEQLGIKKSGLEKLIRKSFELLDLQTFLTAGKKEVRAWTIRKGATAPEAAGVIHTDFEKGFIKAQICDYDDFVEYKGWAGAATAGKTRLEGKDYLMREGDVVEFKFNV